MVDFEVKQDVWIGGDGGLPAYNRSFDILQNRDVTRIKAGTDGKVTKNMSLDLNHIHYVVNGNKFTSRGWNTGRRSLPRSAEEMFQLSHLAPATHAFQAKNTYRLDLNVNFDGCCS